METIDFFKLREMDLCLARKRVLGEEGPEETRDKSSKASKMASDDCFDTEMRRLCIQGHLRDGPPHGELPAEGTPREREVISRYWASFNMLAMS